MLLSLARSAALFGAIAVIPLSALAVQMRRHSPNGSGRSQFTAVAAQASVDVFRKAEPFWRA
jgi:hypothetical protein